MRSATRRQVQERVDNYLRDLSRSIVSTLDPVVTAVSVGGSIAFGDFQFGSSDVDVAVFLDGVPAEAQLSALARKIDHRVLPCPGKGLDLVAFRAQSVRPTPPNPKAAFAFVTGKNWRTELTGSEMNEDLLIDLFVLRNHGWSYYGTNPSELIGLVGDDALRALLGKIVNWHRGKIHDSFHDPSGEFAVLNTCRAWRFLVTGMMGSKSTGGRWALSRRRDLEVIDAALALRRGERKGPLKKGDVLRCMDAIEIEMDRSKDIDQRA